MEVGDEAGFAVADAVGTVEVFVGNSSSSAIIAFCNNSLLVNK